MEERRLEDFGDVLTAEEVAEVLRLGRNTVYDALRSGTIPSVRVGRRLLVPKHALERLLSGDPQSKQAGG